MAKETLTVQTSFVPKSVHCKIIILAAFLPVAKNPPIQCMPTYNAKFFQGGKEGSKDMTEVLMHTYLGQKVAS